MNTKLLASFAVFVLLAAVVSISLTGSAQAAEIKDEMKAKKDAMKKEMKATKDAAKKEMKEKKDALKKETKTKKDAMKKEMKATKDAMKKEMKATKDTMKKEMKAAKDAKAGTASGSAASEVTVDMAQGTASNTECADQCYMPSTVTVTVGGKVTWKNVDSAAHTATATDSSFDTSLVNAGASASNTFSTAGSYPYMCILHPWMKGTVNVQ
jgi:plastocyanin